MRDGEDYEGQKAVQGFAPPSGVVVPLGFSIRQEQAAESSVRGMGAVSGWRPIEVALRYLGDQGVVQSVEGHITGGHTVEFAPPTMGEVVQAAAYRVALGALQDPEGEADLQPLRDAMATRYAEVHGEHAPEEIDWHVIADAAVRYLGMDAWVRE